MSSLLLFALLLTVLLLLRPALGANSVMDLTPLHSRPDYPVDELFPECPCYGEQFLCHLCEVRIQLANITNALSLRPFESDMMTDPVRDGVSYAESPGPSGSGMNMKPVLYGVTGDNRLPLNNENIYAIDANETRVQRLTVQAHVYDTYNTGDHVHTPSDRKHTPNNRKHTPGDCRRRLRIRKPRCEDGYPCDEPGCGRVFDRQCDLTRHSGNHLNQSERPHVCPDCPLSFLNPKDLRRHEPVHRNPLLVVPTFHCQHPDCTNHKGFTREDNLWRHQKKHQSR